ncbi:MAG: molybdenum cofactor cytidylyltransferase [Flavobacteriaceae bacterium]|jgi:molybdenum cofactor cytidylyltransferase
MPSESNIVIIIPAAGASRRIGSPKQLLKWGDSTLISHAIDTAEELGQKEIVLVLGAYYDKIKAEIDNRSIQTLKNEDWENGLGSSIAAGVEYLVKSLDTCDAVLILLPDQPLIVPFYLKTMIDKFKVGENQIIATKYGSGKYGVPALFDKKYFEKLRGLTDDRGAQELIKQSAKFVTTVDINPLISDIDTEEDYKKIYKANHQ